MSQTATTPGDIEALADSLTAVARELHNRIIRAIRHNPPDDRVGPPVMTKDEAEALFEQEVMLRQHAMSLYSDAARLATVGLSVASGQLLESAARAREQIARIDHAKELAGVAASVLGIAAAIAAASGKDLTAAAEDLKDHLDALKKNDLQKPGGEHTMGA